jgi:hypothetical protein
MMRRFLVATAAVTAVAMLVAGVGSAARTQQTLLCNGEQVTVTVTTTTNENLVAWGVGTISGGAHLIPTSFSGSGVDLSTGATLFSFSQAKGNGNGQHNQPSVTCSESEQATAGEFGIPGVAQSDLIEFDTTVTAVTKP